MDNEIGAGQAILVVEDDEGLRRLIEMGIKRLGFQAVGVAEGAQAIEKVGAGTYMLLLLDYQLPDMTAWELVERLNQIQQRVPFVIMTGHGDERIAVEMMKLGSRDYLVKDASFTHLLPEVVSRVARELRMEAELAETAAKLQESQRSLLALMSNLPGMAYRCQNDRQRTMIFVSEGSTELTGYGPSELVGSTGVAYMELIHSDDSQRVWNDIQAALSDKRPFQSVYRIHSARGEEKWVWEKGSGVFSSETELQAIEGFIADITERRRAEQNLQEAYEEERKLRSELEREIKKRVEFTRALVHELKTPLTSVIASSELLTSELPEGPLLRMARNIGRSADNLNKRVDELFDVARGELGMLQLSLTSVDPLPLLQELADEMGPVASNRQQSLALEVPSSLPPVWADGDRLRQVVFNLLGNACKFTGEGGKITLKAREEGDKLIVEVEDTGPGIGEEEQQRLFTAYYRVEGDGKRPRGLGLGLALCKTLVELHGGQIWVRSKKGVGSTFGFSVPLAGASQLNGVR